MYILCITITKLSFVLDVCVAHVIGICGEIGLYVSINLSSMVGE